MDCDLHHRGSAWRSLFGIHRVRILRRHSTQSNCPPPVQQMGEHLSANSCPSITDRWRSLLGRRTARSVPLHCANSCVGPFPPLLGCAKPLTLGQVRVHHLVRALPRRKRCHSRLSWPRNGTNIPPHSQPGFPCPSSTHLRWGVGLDRGLRASRERCDSVHHWRHCSEPRDKELTPYVRWFKLHVRNMY